jgi:prepilin-type N-terminal cleavage/methylation domain-containing protein
VRPNQQGMTLIEIVIALAILSILVLSFFLIFTTSFAHIFRMGSKTSAMSDAQEVIDAVYISRDTSEAYLDAIRDEDFLKLTDCVDLPNYAYDGTHRFVYCVGSETLVDSVMTTVTVKVFYGNGSESVVLSSVIP